MAISRMRRAGVLGALLLGRCEPQAVPRAEPERCAGSAQDTHSAQATASEKDLGIPSAMGVSDPGMSYEACAQHIRYMDWNENVSQSVWNARLGQALFCLRSGPRLAREKKDARPAAFGGIHVPTVIAPTDSQDIPSLPPFYVVLPLWDMAVSSRARLFRTYDHGEVDVLLKLVAKGDVFIDVGANVGAVTLPLAAAVGEEGTVFAFEPFRQVFQYLNANVAANGLSNVHTFQSALSDATAPARMRVPAPTLVGGLSAGTSGAFQGAPTETSRQTPQRRERMEDVRVQTLDSFALPRADLIKIDLEGHAANVFAGAIETIRRHRPVLWFEHSADTAPEVLQHPDLGYWCTKLLQATEEQFICVPREKHADVIERLDAE